MLVTSLILIVKIRFAFLSLKGNSYNERRRETIRLISSVGSGRPCMSIRKTAHAFGRIMNTKCVHTQTKGERILLFPHTD